MNMGLFENAVKSAIAYSNPSTLYTKSMIHLLDLIVMSDMADFNYSDRLAVAIFTVKDLLQTHLKEIEAKYAAE